MSDVMSAEVCIIVVIGSSQLCIAKWCVINESVFKLTVPITR